MELYLPKPIFAVLFLPVIPEYLLNRSILLDKIAAKIEMSIQKRLIFRWGKKKIYIYKFDVDLLTDVC